MAEARHVQGIGNVAAGLVRQQLQVRVGVVVGHQHRVLFPQQVFDPADTFVPLLAGELFDYRLRHLLRRQPEIQGCNGAVHIFGTSAPGLRGQSKNSATLTLIPEA